MDLDIFSDMVVAKVLSQHILDHCSLVKPVNDDQLKGSAYGVIMLFIKRLACPLDMYYNFI
jgi:hypothetical protein